MKRPAWMAAAILSAALSGSLEAQNFGLSSTALRIAEPVSVTLTGGPPDAPYVVGLDGSPGPVTVATVGTMSLGFTPALFLVTWLQLDGQGHGGFTASVFGEPSYVGNMVYAQAATIDPSSPSGSRLSNPLARGFHPPHPTAASTQSLSLGEDTAVSIFLPFPAGFPFYGGAYTQVGVSSNGLLTFTGISVDPTESIGDLLAGLPKIAVLWDDLSPQVRGEVVARSGPGFFQVSYRDVPQFYVLDHNWATATLYQDGTITIEWSDVGLQDSLVGLSPGSWLGAFQFEDFSRASATGTIAGSDAIFEQFTPGSRPFDLANSLITFLRLPGTGGYRWFR